MENILNVIKTKAIITVEKNVKTLNIEVEINGDGHLANLHKSNPQGFNSKILLLEIIYANTEEFFKNPQSIKSLPEQINSLDQYSEIQVTFNSETVANLIL